MRFDLFTELFIIGYSGHFNDGFSLVVDFFNRSRSLRTSVDFVISAIPKLWPSALKLFLYRAIFFQEVDKDHSWLLL